MAPFKTKEEALKAISELSDDKIKRAAEIAVHPKVQPYLSNGIMFQAMKVQLNSL